MEFQTKLIHGNWNGDIQTGATNVPIYYSNAFKHETAKEIENIFAGRELGYVYSRIANPTVEAFEKRITAVEGGIGALATSSGMAAIYLTLMNILRPGDEIISSSGIFGGTYTLLKNLEEYDIRVKFADKIDAGTLEREITDKTKLVFTETIGNPRLDVVDMEAVSNICKEKNVIMTVDSTLTTPYLIKPLDYGADIVIHSTSKFINGNANAVGGVIVDGGSTKYGDDKYTALKRYARRFGKSAFIARLRTEIAKDLGAIMSPMNGFLSLIAIETLGLRMQAHCDNALKVAGFLAAHAGITDVNYPLLRNSADYQTAQKYYGKGAGAVITFRLGSKENAFKFIDNLKLVSNLVNIGDSKTLVVHPASTICVHHSLAEKTQMGVYEDMVRISVGIEDCSDILEDIDQALGRL